MSTAARAAGPPPQPSAAQIQLALAKLGVAGSVLYVAAHPDDENTSLLAYLANGLHLRAGYLSLTRGDGGQNLIGAEQGPELGLIRTQELLAARRIDGAEQFFTRARDFGYSKSPEETLRVWGREAVLSDLVSVIRRFRPDVIVSRFSPEPSDTHGHHTASAMLAVEAFRAAADPRFHPEELTGEITTWQARRLLWNRFTMTGTLRGSPNPPATRSGEASSPSLARSSIRPGDDLSAFDSLDAGGYNPLLGVSYGEMAAESRSMHKSQGFGVARNRGPVVEYFKTLIEAGAPAGRGSPFRGIDFSLARWSGTGALRAAVERAQTQFDPTHPEAAIPALAAVDAELDGLPDASWRARKRREVQDLMLACAGFFADASAADFRVAPGDELEITATAVNRSVAPLALREVRFPAGAGTIAVARALAAPAGGAAAPPLEWKRTLRIPADAPLTTPYWLASPPSPGLFTVADRALIGFPEDPQRLSVDFVLDLAGRTLVVPRAIAFKWTDPVAGERYRPLEITPRVSVRPDAPVLLFPERDRKPRPLIVHLTAGAASVKGALHIEAPPGWTVDPPSAPFAFDRKGQERELTFQVRREASVVHDLTPGTLRAVAEVAGGSAGDEASARFARGVVRIEHAHIPIQTWLAPAEVRLVPLALEIAGTRIGYFSGPGDEVPASLRRVGYDVTLLDEPALRDGAAGLARFDAVVTGVRAFNTSERLRAAHPILMSYVEAGGTLVVQYNTNSRLAPLTAPIGPYPFDIGRDRVTDETSAVSLAAGAPPVLTTPNRIGARDFEGWIQERGLYFAEKWDARYQAPLAMNDPGEEPLAGSLLWARHGKGTYVYTGLAFFRQLPAGVPGAYRLFANLLARTKGTRGH
ncbi:MAG TPA: PIG-L family deacetylase [Polyangia bacterium]|nr:PIG-L family deacetylase [Polyangia bacterium]